jgi:hypothetical protein
MNQNLIYKNRNNVNKIKIILNGYATLWYYLMWLNDEKEGCT